MGPKTRTAVAAEQKKRQKTLLVTLLLLLLILLPLSTVATYTWFSISRTPKVSDMEMTINSAVGLQIAWSADAAEDEWKQQLNFIDQVPSDTLLTPVTWSDAQQCFYTTTFGPDGRVSGVDVKLNDDMDANGRDGHYVKFTVYGRTEERVTVSLSPAVEIEEGKQGAGTYLIGTPLWDAETLSHQNGGDGAQYATRVGLRVTILDTAGNPTGEPVFYLYEPNGDRHVDGSEGYQPTPSMDGTAELVPEARHIRQTTSEWEESEPVQRDVVIRRLGEFEREVELFRLEEQQKVKIDVYIWLEGMDVDCVNAIGQSAQLFANVQFLAKPTGNSGLVPIE